MRKRKMALIGAVALSSSTAIIAWMYRADIVTHYVDQALAERGVTARYRIDHLGPGSQRITNIVIGDPAAPDLVIDRLDLNLVLGLDGPRIASADLDGVRLRGRVTDAGLSFGAVDRLIPADDGTPFELPDMQLGLRAVAISITTPWGPVGIGANGRGDLTRRFSGHVAARGERLAAGDCVAQEAIARLQISIIDRVPHFVGPVGAERVQCADTGVAVRDIRIGLDGRLDAALQRVQLSSRVRTGQVGSLSANLTGLTGTLDARGDVDGHIQSRWALRGLSPDAHWMNADDVVVEGSAGRSTGGVIVARASVRAARLRSGEPMRRAALSLRSAGVGLPIEPLVGKLADAVARAGDGASLTANLSADKLANGPLRVAVGQVRLDARSGAFVHLAGDDVVVASSNAPTRVALNGRFGGGNLPSGSIYARTAGDSALALSGQLRLAPIAAQNAELALAPIRFDSDGQGGTRFATALRLSGPLDGGRVDQLTMRLQGRVNAQGAVSLSGACQPVSWAALRAGDMAIGASTIGLCGDDPRGMVWAGPQGLGGSVRFGATQLSGRVGEQPFNLSVAGGRANIGGRRFSLDGLAVALGDPAEPSRLDMATLEGQSAESGLAGQFAGLNVSLAAVPLLLGDSAGDWRWAEGALSLDAALTVRDRAADPRFNPLLSRDVALRFADGVIVAQGSLQEPTTASRVARVAIEHRLAGQRGEARLAIDGIQFRPDGLQPATLSRLGLGVIADADGAVRGNGTVRWADGAVTSDGRFSTDGLDFAAAFGPVKGLRGTLELSDLLALESPAGQRFQVASINPGIEVTDGVIDFQLLPDNRVQVESGRWPFAGGTLALRPTVLDFDVTRARELTFDLSGVDAGLFLARYEFDNINATGVFDGTIPTVFDANGGRIVAGALRSRAGGGLSYLGELTYRDLGYFGNLAFQSLRSIRYDALSIRLDGQIDGDMVTEVDFSGLAQGEGVENNLLTRAIRSLPVIFRIRMNAPFRSLLTSARGLYDPTLLIEQNLPALLRAQRERDAAAAAGRDSGVQPGVSEDER